MPRRGPPALKRVTTNGYPRPFVVVAQPRDRQLLHEVQARENGSPHEVARTADGVTLFGDDLPLSLAGAIYAWKYEGPQPWPVASPKSVFWLTATCRSPQTSVQIAALVRGPCAAVLLCA